MVLVSRYFKEGNQFSHIGQVTAADGGRITFRSNWCLKVQTIHEVPPRKSGPAAGYKYFHLFTDEQKSP